MKALFVAWQFNQGMTFVTGRKPQRGAKLSEMS
jgi:hypothetical protein